jgi:hypothetical protein
MRAVNGNMRVDGTLSTYEVLTYKYFRASRGFSKLMPTKNTRILETQKLRAVGIMNNFRRAGDASLPIHARHFRLLSVMKPEIALQNRLMLFSYTSETRLR